MIRLEAIISLDWIEFVSALLSRVSPDTSVVLRNPRGISRLITGGSTLNLTSAFQIHPDAVDPLRVFLGNHTSDLVYYVGLTVYLESVYGTFSIPYCYQFPGNTIAACPSSRAPSAGGLRGGSDQTRSKRSN